MRKIIAFSTATSVFKEIMSAARTWGDLKSAVKDAGIDPTGMKIMIKETKVSIETDASVLPEGEFTLFITSAKIKSGSSI